MMMHQNLKARNERIVDLRLEGKKYHEIGDVYGISRERVRQLLAKAERESGERLTGFYYKQRLCKECGKDITKMCVMKGHRNIYCSTECFVAHKAPKHDWADMIITGRLSGESWQEIGKKIDCWPREILRWAAIWLPRLVPSNIAKQALSKHTSGQRPHSDWIAYRASIKAKNAGLLEEWRKFRENSS